VLATETGDHCWIATVAHGQARLAAARGDAAGALGWCRTGLRPQPWYLWPRARLLDAGCELAALPSPAEAGRWAAELAEIAGRGAMQELTVRALAHRARLGDRRAAVAAPSAALDVDNPALHRLLAPEGVVA